MRNSTKNHRASWIRIALIVLVSSLRVNTAAALTPDTNFHPPSFATAAPAQRVLLLPGGNYFLFYLTDTLTDQRTGAITRFLSDGQLDPSFDFSREYKFVGAAAPAAGGKLYVAANKSLYGAAQSDEILRLNSDGSIDPSFHSSVVGVYQDQSVRQIRVLPDGKVLVAGLFPYFAGEEGSGIVRLLSNGDVDSSFVAVGIFAIYAMTLQADGKILLGGGFSGAGGNAVPGVTRLNADGSVDPTFHAAGFVRSSSAPIRAVTVQSDGKILVGGRLRIGMPGHLVSAPIFRLLPDGSPDASFSLITTLPNAPNARDIVVQPDGKFVAAINDSVYRVNADGSLDSTFHQALFQDTSYYAPGLPGTTITLNLLPDGRIVVGGAFTDVDPPGSPTRSRFGVARLNASGTVDPSFTTRHRTGYKEAPTSFARLSDGSTLIGFDTLNVPIEPAIPYNFGRLLADGSIDSAFTLSSSDPSGLLSGGFLASGFSPTPDGSFVVFGKKEDNSVHLGKVSAHGVVQTGLDPDSSPTSFQSAKVLPDGKIFLSAGNDPQSTVYAVLRRLQSDGQLDASFHLDESITASQVPRDFDGNLFALYFGSRLLAVQSDGKVIFEYFTADRDFRLVRLKTDGAIDESFSAHFPGYGASQTSSVIFDPLNNQTVQPPDGTYSAPFAVLDAVIQPDGRMLIAGQFTSFADVAANALVRLMPDGSMDNSFNIGAGAQWTSTEVTAGSFPKVENVVLQGDGRLLIIGTFEAFNGTPAPGIVRLNPNGSVDTSFVPPATRDKHATGDGKLERQSDGSFLLSGPYSLPGQSTAPSIVHILGAPAVANISTRIAIGDGDNVMIGGFIITGSTPKNVLVRAIAPSLTVNGTPIAGRLLDPVLELHGSAGVLATNDDWRSAQEQEIIYSTIPPSDDRESAIVATLEPGAYTAVMHGKNGATGIGLVEVYDFGNPSAVTAQQASVANISTRGSVQTGDNVMIGGFIVTGDRTRVIVRAIGPDLTNSGVPGALQDTTLDLYGPNGLVASNDDWRSTQEQEIIDSTVPPHDNRESAIVASLDPGGYTAVVRGKDGATGVGLVEVYVLP